MSKPRIVVVLALCLVIQSAWPHPQLCFFSFRHRVHLPYYSCRAKRLTASLPVLVYHPPVARLQVSHLSPELPTRPRMYWGHYYTGTSPPV
jgi:hypothetical protein